MATPIGYGYEGLTEGQAIPTGGANFWTSWVANTITALARAAAATTGSMGCTITNVTTGEGGYFIKDFTATGVFTWSVEFYLPTPPTSGQQRLFDLGDGSSQFVRLDQNSDNRLLVRNAAGTTISSPQMGMATAGTVGHKYRWRGYWAKGTTTSNGTLRSELTNLTTSTLVVDNQSTALNVGTTDATRLRLGYSLSTNAGVVDFRHDNIVIARDPSSISDLVTPTPPASAPVAAKVVTSSRIISNAGVTTMTGTVDYSTSSDTTSIAVTSASGHPGFDASDITVTGLVLTFADDPTRTVDIVIASTLTGSGGTTPTTVTIEPLATGAPPADSIDILYWDSATLA